MFKEEQEMKKKVRVRYAPSPTGFLHIGNARTALFNYLFARHHGGDFIIRIEDTDVKRNVRGGEKSQLDYLKWLGIDWDESIDVGGPYAPYRQIDRLPIYKKYADQLVDKGLAYKCYCQGTTNSLKYPGTCKHLTPAQQQAFEDQGITPALRFSIPSNHEITFDDMVKGSMSFQSDDFGDFIIMKQDGIPTYQFAVVVDDHEMDISHVLRGDDHLSNTPKQIMLYQALNFPVPTFGHMTLIVNEYGKKLSKRDTNITQYIEDFKQKGYTPQALFNFISFLGWSPVGTQTHFTKEELIQHFDPTRLSKSPAFFDQKLLRNYNNHYLKEMSDSEFISFVLPFLANNPIIEKQSKEWIEDFISLYKKELSSAEEIREKVSLFTTDNSLPVDNDEILSQDHVTSMLTVFKNNLQSSDWTKETIQSAISQTKTESKQKGKQLMMPIRLVTTHQNSGPDLVSTLFLLGKEKVMNRIQDFLTKKVV